MKLTVYIILDQFIQQYKLQYLVHKGFIYIEIQKVIYGMTQSGKISNHKLKQYPSKFGHEPEPITLDFGGTKHGYFNLHL